MDVVTPEASGQPRVVIWLVPSLTILEQTERNFSDPQHPYRQRCSLGIISLRYHNSLRSETCSLLLPVGGSLNRTI